MPANVDFVSELLASSCKSIEPCDDPLSYQESIHFADLSFTYERPRIRAEFLYTSFITLVSLALRFSSAVCAYFYDLVLSLCFAFKVDHNFDNIEPRKDDNSHQIGHAILLLTPSFYANATRAAFHAMSMPAKPLAPDKHHFSILIASLTVLLLTFCVFQWDSEGEIRSSSLCGSAVWLPRRHRSLRAFCQSTIAIT
ncbi:hypothetical protein B0H13DRAFT_2311319 [Mycena leptocephala]|nr:hypothetical protein B0H13DRAFT_2311319 [Mycena leptocephala]